MPTINGKVYNDVLWKVATRTVSRNYEGFYTPDNACWEYAICRMYERLETCLLEQGAEPKRLSFLEEVADEELELSFVPTDDGRQGLRLFRSYLN